MLRGNGYIHKVGIITLVLSMAHVIEDLALLLVGRYTTIHIWMILLGTVGFSLLVGVVARLPQVKKFLGG